MRFDSLQQTFDSLHQSLASYQQTMMQIGALIIAALIGVIATQL
jgi:hypothetical protein